MCGICGWFNSDRAVDFKVLKKMNNIAAYRGPDDEGYVGISADRVDPYVGKDSCIDQYPDAASVATGRYFLGFGHRRLSILDLSVSGHQPMISPDGAYCIIFNGEIYNYLEIKKDLADLGYVFRSTSDTEVLLDAYMEWGEECVRRLNGMWAFAIWDRKKNVIFCSRDRLGAKPFHYYVDDRNFIFSSELKQLCQNPCVPRVMNDGYMVTQIAWKLTDYSEETPLKDVKMIASRNPDRTLI